jgi:excisionase family DNA binding protein
MSDDEIVLLRIESAARLLSVSSSRAYLLARQGRLPGAVRLAGTWRVNRRVLEAWANRAAQESDDRGPDVDSEPPGIGR